MRDGTLLPGEFQMQQLGKTIICLAVTLIGCGEVPIGSVDPQSRVAAVESGAPNASIPLASRAVDVTEMSPAKRALFDSIVALMPNDRRQLTARALGTSMTRLDARHMPDVQKLLDRFYAQSNTTTQGTAADVQVDATVALVDELPDVSADAVVMRRTRALPHDVILLRSAHVTEEALGSAIQALFELRKQMGDIPTKDVHLTVRGAKRPSHWKKGGQGARASRDLALLKQSKPRALVGIGHVRSIELPLVSVAAWKNRKR